METDCSVGLAFHFNNIDSAYGGCFGSEAGKMGNDLLLVGNGYVKPAQVLLRAQCFHCFFNGGEVEVAIFGIDAFAAELFVEKRR